MDHAAVSEKKNSVTTASPGRKSPLAGVDVQELCAYIFFGVLSLLFNIWVFKFLLFCGIDYRLANLITLILLKIFVFITNKLYVFKTSARDILSIFREFVRFLAARILTNLIDFFGLILLVEICKRAPFYSKIFLAIVVIILNFFFSKLFVFRKQGNG